MKAYLRVAITFLSLINFAGCASLNGGSTQSIAVNTKKSGVTVTGANCDLSNDKGRWAITTPDTATVHRSYGDLLIVCNKSGKLKGSLTVKAAANTAATGDISFGGPIGSGVDILTGAAYAYPTTITVELE